MDFLLPSLYGGSTFSGVPPMAPMAPAAACWASESGGELGGEDPGGPGSSGRTKCWTGEPRRAGRQRRGASRRVPSLPLPREPPSVAPTPPNCPTNLRCLISYRSVNSKLFFLHIKLSTGFKSVLSVWFFAVVGLPKLHCCSYVLTVEVWNR